VDLSWTEIARASRHRGTAHSATVELARQGPGAVLGHGCLRLLGDLPEDVLHLVTRLQGQLAGSATLG